jgi:hypothetical protein
MESVSGAIATGSGTHASGAPALDVERPFSSTPEACVPTRSLSLPVLIS